MNSQSFFRRLLVISLMILSVLCMVGCRAETKENIYHVKEYTTIDEYIMLSNVG